MLSQDLLTFIKDELAYLSGQNASGYNQDVEKRAYAQTVKLSEEVGELSEAVLARFGNQRDKDGKTYSIDGEIADIIIVLLILGQHLEIDVNKALEQKIQKIIERRKTRADS